MTEGVSAPLRIDTTVLLLGVGTMAVSLTAGASVATYEGVGLVGYRAAGSALLDLLLLIATVVTFASAVGRAPTRRRAMIGLILAVAAWPTTLALLLATYAVLNDVLHIYW